MSALLLALAGLCTASAGVDAGGYLRVMTRPDFQGGDGKLGYWNLYGRLLNEGPYAALELKVDPLEREPGGTEVWTSAHLKVEGGSIANADTGNGNLGNMRLSQAYVEAGNVLLQDVSWQVGTLDKYMGDLGLYDMRPAEIFYDTVGLSARYNGDVLEVLVGAGDSGWAMKGSDYNTVFTGGGTIRVRSPHLEAGTGGEYHYEPAVPGNRNAPYQTPGVDYEDYLRGEVVQSWTRDNPLQAELFPPPEPLSAASYKAIWYLGFGDAGPLRWNNLFASYALLHPEGPTSETWDGRTEDIYVTSLTDERTVLLVGDELQLRLWPGHLDAALGALYGAHNDADNDLGPSDHDRWYASSVLRLQYYITDTVHFLAEGSVAREVSLNGNAYREHADSIFENTAGVPDARGFEDGDTDTRDTAQGKVGFVLNPLGPGIYARPSLRILYGIQQSNVNNAFGNSFVETLDQYNTFGNVEQHMHHVVALETEVWF